MAITAYTDIISLERAKNYLKIDDGMNLDDVEITSMINGAFLFMERYTSYIFMEKDFTYDGYGCYSKVYHFPINEFTPSTTVQKLKPLYSIFDIPYGVDFTYKAGYTEASDVPDDFIQSVLQIIKVWYYESEKQVNDQIIPIATRQVLDTYRRFV